MNKKIDIREYNIKALAYIGDGVYELYIREYLVANSRETANVLHKKAIRYVSAKAQEYIVNSLLENNILLEEEIAIYKRGRNADSNTVPKNTDISTYKKATGFEAVIGAIYLQNNIERVKQIIAKTIEITNERIGVKDE